MKYHYIYVMGRDSGPVKVGITAAPDARLSAIQTGCHFKIEILHIRTCSNRENAIEHERSFHAIYQDKRLAGEWFDMDADLAIEGIESAFEIEHHFRQEARLEWMAAQLNIWQWGEDGSHPHH